MSIFSTVLYGALKKHIIMDSGLTSGGGQGGQAAPPPGHKITGKKSKKLGRRKRGKERKRERKRGKEGRRKREEKGERRK